ncbi:hypothetical protein [Salipiger marinus]|uniref:Phage tail tape measure protein, lambda family n=1 Tax=Salipiger marinus TaxID=555512 RepID=A0A1G8RXZ2_9RHOB|nr:hypothetical protein [Salipiger marinus]SDJ21425.1 hypothetical protein SAMN04487993_102214 [Salipiger marinus]
MAQSVIGALRVNLGLDSAQFERGAQRTRSAVADMRSRFVALTGAVAAIGAGLAALSRNTVTAGAEISRLSQVSNTAPDLFQRWAAAAQTVGVEQDKLADILKDVNDRVGDFLQTGGGPMADFFDKIAPKVGVTAEEFRHLSGPQALQLYVDSLQKAGVSQGEMTFYLEAMASDLTLLLPLLQQGGAEMTRLGDRADAVGAVMSGETVEALRRTGLALSEMGQAVSAAANILGAAFAPMMERAATAMVAAMMEGGALRVVVEGLAGNLDFLVTTTGVAVAALGARYVGAVIAARFATFSLTGALAGLRAAMLSLGFPALIIGAGALVTWLSRLIERTGGWGTALTLLGEVAAGVWDGIGSAAAAIPPTLAAVWQQVRAGFYTLMADLARGWAKFVTGLHQEALSFGLDGLAKSLGDSANKVWESVGDFEKSSEAATNAAAGLREEAAGLASAGLGKAREALARLGAAAKVSAGDMGGAAGAAADLRGAMAGISGQGEGGEGGRSGAAGRTAQALRDVSQAARSAASSGMDRLGGALDSLSDGMAGAIIQGRSLRDALAQVFQQIGQDFLSSGIRDLLGSVFKGAGGGLIASVFGGFRAEGGPVSPGRAYMVGERGPEMIVPQGAGTVIPNHQLSASGISGASIVQNFSIDARGAQEGVADQIERRLQAMRPQLAQDAVGAVRASSKKYPIR